jgi:ADP-dependent NAD(P)H-hydrate dehydratase / NAD(P)H-hydrate epimerase
MEHTYWQKQTKAAPLFPNIIWSRPENRLHAGKLLIVGGNGYEFKAAANAYGDALDAGIGTAKVILPASMQKTIATLFPEAEFAPYTPSGSFARSSLAAMLDAAEWADAVLLAGDMGRNSETAIVIEQLLQKYKGHVALVNDAVDYCLNAPVGCLDRSKTTLVITTAQLQKLGTGAAHTPAFTSTMDLVPLVENLHAFSLKHPCNLVIIHAEQLIVASNGNISSTVIQPGQTVDPTEIAARTAVWWRQNPSKAFEALTTGLVA